MNVYCNVTVGVLVMGISVGSGVFRDVIISVADGGVVGDGPRVLAAVGVGEICVGLYVGDGVSLIVGEAMGVQDCLIGTSFTCRVTVGVSEPVGGAVSVMVGVNVGGGVIGANVDSAGILRVGTGVHVSVIGVGSGVAVCNGSNSGHVEALS